MNINKNERNIALQIAENNENKSDGSVFERGKKLINEYMNNKFKRLLNILLKEHEMKMRTLREKIEIEREREIVRFEEKIKLIELRQTKLIDGFEREGFPKKEKIISIDEDSGEENEEIVNKKAKRKPTLKRKRYHLDNSA